MQSRMQGLRWKAYAALKEPDIEKLLVELERAKSSLQLALTTYNVEEQQLRALSQEAELLEQRLQLVPLHHQLLLDPYGTRQQETTEPKTRRYQLASSEETGLMRKWRTA
jgi:hypothetical protein